jgi:aldose 1-epimerase
LELVDIMTHSTNGSTLLNNAERTPIATFLPLGAIVQSFNVNGFNIVQNFPTTDLYEKHNNPYFGETIGRVANRISGAKINSLNSREYQLASNDGPNSLHGGIQGWGKRTFEGPMWIEKNGKEVIMFSYISPDGEEGFPGELEVHVYYSVSTSKTDGTVITTLEIEYEAELLGPSNVEETVVAMTNHR